MNSPNMDSIRQTLISLRAYLEREEELTKLRAGLKARLNTLIAQTNPGRPPKPWARFYDQCLKCGRHDKPHAGNGLCRNCKARERYWAIRKPGEGGNSQSGAQ